MFPWLHEDDLKVGGIFYVFTVMELWPIYGMRKNKTLKMENKNYSFSSKMTHWVNSYYWLYILL